MPKSYADMPVTFAFDHRKQAMLNAKVTPLTDEQLREKLVKRPDPYFGNLWEVPGFETGVTWRDAHEMRRLLERPHLPQPRWMAIERKFSREEAYDEIFRPEHSATHWNHLKVIAATFMWRGATFEQIWDLTDMRYGMVEQSLPHYIVVPWAAGVIQWGVPTGYLRHIRMARPARPSKSFLNRMSGYDMFATFAWRTELIHGRSVRHNILNTEVSLRTAEWHRSSFPVMLGEGFGLAKTLLRDSTGVSHNALLSVGDAVWVRNDGLRIVVETGNGIPSIREKILRWVEVMENDPTNSIALLFVVPNRHKGSSKWLTRLMSAISDVFVDNRARMRTPAATSRRIAVVEWQEWFPDANAVDESLFGNLVVHGMTNGGEDWEEFSLLDPFRLPCDADPTEVQKSIRRARHLLGVPQFLITPQHLEPLYDDFINMARMVSAEGARRRREEVQQYGAF